MKFTDMFGNEYELTFKTMKYSNNGSLAVFAVIDGGEPYATVTKNMPASDLIGENQAFLDYNNCGNLVDAMVENEYIQYDGKVTRSGFCEYPLFTFTDKFFAEAV